MLPHADQAVVDVRKLRDYALSLENERGRHKALVFRSALGLGPEDAGWLSARILDAVLTADAVETETTPCGVLYRADLTVETETGAAVVRTGWIVRSGETFPRLTTLYVR